MIWQQHLKGISEKGCQWDGSIRKPKSNSENDLWNLDSKLSFILFDDKSSKTIFDDDNVSSMSQIKIYQIFQLESLILAQSER